MRTHDRADSATETNLVSGSHRGSRRCALSLQRAAGGRWVRPLRSAARIPFSQLDKGCMPADACNGESTWMVSPHLALACAAGHTSCASLQLHRYHRSPSAEGYPTVGERYTPHPAPVFGYSSLMHLIVPQTTQKRLLHQASRHDPIAFVTHVQPLRYPATCLTTPD